MISNGKKSLTKGGAGRVRERRDGRRGVAAQGHRVSGEETVKHTLSVLLDEAAFESVGAEPRFNMARELD